VRWVVRERQPGVPSLQYHGITAGRLGSSDRRQQRAKASERPFPAVGCGANVDGMPLLYVDLVEGRSPEEIRALLDAIHDAVVEAFAVPPRDRYQVVNTHPTHEMVLWDTGLGIDRSSQRVVLHIVSRRRSTEMKQKFYELAAANLAARCGLDSADLVISITENDDADWSFGYGRAQFLTGELT
jgi:phenylpyruvate tautomerase PptA (4-oxalocrotonate tautomerase family)